MALPNIFKQETTDACLARIEKLTPQSQPLWGKMNVAQMLAHVSVSYDMAFGKIEVKNNFFMKLMLKLFIKKPVTNEVPYKKNLQTAPQFLITDERAFEKEKAHLIDNIKKTQEYGESYFDGKESASFGKLTVQEWNNLFYKHLNHHLQQFGV
ncbi:MAG: DUF1569 domain-containing protein [Flavobacteriales bacterium]|nr:DUF1569 domain-containing protein [Flavobacteriales bacterium]